jgi:hypothetical protein
LPLEFNLARPKAHFRTAAPKIGWGMQAAGTNKERLGIPNTSTAASLWKDAETCTVTYTVAHQLNHISFVIKAKFTDARDLDSLSHILSELGSLVGGCWCSSYLAIGTITVLSPYCLHTRGTPTGKSICPFVAITSNCGFLARTRKFVRTLSSLGKP